MADPILQFVDVHGGVHPTPEHAAVADITIGMGLVGVNAAIARKVLESRAVIEQAFRDLDRITEQYGETIAAQEIDRRARKPRPKVKTPGPASGPAPTQENESGSVQGD